MSALYINATQLSEPRLDTEPDFGISAKAWEDISGAKFELWRLKLNSVWNQELPPLPLMR